MTRPCIFCEIVAGRAEATIVHQDEHCLALMDLYPLSVGHVLVIPKQHGVQITELEPHTASHLLSVAHAILVAQRHAGFGVSGTNLLLNDGPAANQTVAHTHIHLIPRQRRDGPALLVKLALHVSGVFGFSASRTALRSQAEKIRQALVNAPTTPHG